MQFFSNYPHWTHVVLHTIQFAKGNDWIDFVKSFPSTLERLTLTNIKVPYNSNRVTYTKGKVPLKNLKELEFYEDPDYNKIFLKRTGYRYAPYNAIIAFGEMPELKKLVLGCKNDSALREHSMLDTVISDFFKSQKLNKLEMLAVGFEKLHIEDFRLISAGIKELHLFGFEDASLIREIWNAMSNKGLATISISFLDKNDDYFDDIDVTTIENREPLLTIETLNQLTLCYDQIKMPLFWYRSFFQTQPNLTILKFKWLRKDVLKSAIKMLPKLQEIHYEKFFNPSDSDDDKDDGDQDELESADEFDEVTDLAAYYNLIKTSRHKINKDVILLKKAVRNEFRINSD